MNQFQKGLTAYFTEEQLKRIAELKVGIAGAGGLGSNCAVNLVRSGFQKFVIADFDRVEASNLNRQFYFLNQLGEYKVAALKDNLLAINPDLELVTLPVLITKDNCDEIFGDCDVLVEAFDQPIVKQMFLEHFWDSSKLLVAASGIAGFGDSDRLAVKRLRENVYLIGDRVSGIDLKPPFSPCVNIAAAKQADLILAYALEGTDEDLSFD